MQIHWKKILMVSFLHFCFVCIESAISFTCNFSAELTFRGPKEITGLTLTVVSFYSSSSSCVATLPLRILMGLCSTGMLFWRWPSIIVWQLSLPEFMLQCWDDALIHWSPDTWADVCGQKTDVHMLEFFHRTQHCTVHEKLYLAASCLEFSVEVV